MAIQLSDIFVSKGVQILSKLASFFLLPNKSRSILRSFLTFLNLQFFEFGSEVEVDEKDFSKRAQMIMSQETANQRLQPRTPSYQMVTVQTEGRTFPAYMRDISSNGAFLFTRADAEKGMQLTLEMLQPGSNEKFIVDAEVVRVEQQPCLELKGVAFKFAQSKTASETN